MRISLLQVILLAILFYLFYFNKPNFIIEAKKTLSSFIKDIKNQNSLRRK